MDDMGNSDLERQIALAKEAFVWMSKIDIGNLTTSSYDFFHPDWTVGLPINDLPQPWRVPF